jgi:hypothetical protein
MQALIDKDVYMKIPQGWHICHGRLTQHSDPRHQDTNHYIKLLKTLYGIKQATRKWHKHIASGLRNTSFTASCIDPCLFLQRDCIIQLYVDDCLIFAPDGTIIDTIIHHLSASFKIGEQGSVQDFLGV